MSSRLRLGTPGIVFSVTVAVCALGGWAASSLQDPVYEAASRVEVEPVAGTGQGGVRSSQEGPNEAQSQAEVVRSEAVLRIAAQKLGLRSTAPLKKTVAVEPIGSTRVVEIRARRPTPNEASRWANAVTDAFVDLRRVTAISNSVAAGQLMNEGIKRAEGQIASLEAQIEQNPGGAQSLRAQKEQLEQQVSALRAQLSALPEAEAMRRGTVTVLSRAQPPADPSRRPFRDAGMGAGGGAILGAFLAWKARKRHKPQPEIDAISAGHGRVTGTAAPQGGAEEPGAASQALWNVSERLSGLEQSVGLLVQRNGSGGSGTVGVEELGVWLREMDKQIARRLQNFSSRILANTEATQQLTVAELHSLTQKLEAAALLQLGEQIESVQRSVETGFSGIQAGLSEELMGLLESLESKMEGQGGALFEGFSLRIKAIDQTLTSLREALNAVTGPDAAWAQQRMLSQQETISGKLETVEARLETEAAIAAQTARTADLLFAELRAVQDKINRTGEQISKDLMETARLGQAETASRLGRVDSEMTERMGTVAVQLARALDGIRNDLADNITTSQRGLVAILEAVEGRREADGDLRGRLNGVLRHLAEQVRGLDYRLAEAMSEIKESVLAGTGPSRRELKERLTALEALVTERTGIVAAEATGRLADIQRRLSEDLVGQQEGMSTMLEAVEAKIEGREATLTRRLAGRLKSIEEAVASLQEGRLERTGPRDPKGDASRKKAQSGKATAKGKLISLPEAKSAKSDGKRSTRAGKR